jgi:hypothetical protein
VNSTNQTARTAWYVTPTVTCGGLDFLGATSAQAFGAGLGGFLNRMAAQLARTIDDKGLILIDGNAATVLGVNRDSNSGRWIYEGAPRENAARCGWTGGKAGPYTRWWNDAKIQIWVGILPWIVRPGDPGVFPFAGQWPQDMVAGLQHWHRQLGMPWHAGPAVMGLELMEARLGTYRQSGVKGYRRPDLKCTVTDEIQATEPMWSPQMWRRDQPEAGEHLHGWDKRRAGLVAAGQAKLSPPELIHTGARPFDPKRAGWWQISTPPWNDPRMPHPAGPPGIEWQRQWVTTPTMDLLHELADAGVIDAPEVINSFTGPARPLLQGWYTALETAYAKPVGGEYEGIDAATIQRAVKECAHRGLGMLAHEGSSIYRPDWYHAVNATKRANAWRKLWAIGQTEDRWPDWLDDDCIWYRSRESDPVAAKPAGITWGNRPGHYGYAGTPRTRACDNHPDDQLCPDCTFKPDSSA